LKRERELRAVVALDFANGERKRLRELLEKIEAGAEIDTSRRVEEE
jgi:hypothetical protein